jgi:SAM-dependent methyltransferase
VDRELLDALRTESGRAALAAAAEVAGDEPLAAAASLRARGLPASLAAAALTQAALRRKAVGKFGSAASAMFFSRTGLEQSTRDGVAARRAARLAASGARTVADLGCGIGADTIAFARAGLWVLAVDLDPLTAALAQANVAALGLAERVKVYTMDVADVPLDEIDAVYCDPARRSMGTGQRTFNPFDYSPSWDFIAGLPDRVPKVVVKLGPGIDHAMISPAAEAEWVSVDGDVVEATVWCGIPSGTPRRAVLFRRDDVATLDGSGFEQAPVGPVRRYLFDPDGAVVRSHLVAEFAKSVDGTIADPTIAYVYTDSPVATPFGRCYEVLEELPATVKKLRSALRTRGIGALTILKRGSSLDVEQLRRDLKLSGPALGTLVLTRVAGQHVALLVQPARQVAR